MSETIAIVDYGSGNLHSAAKGLERAAGDAGLSVDVVVTGEPDVVASADRAVLPGVGAFGDCAAGLRAIDGMTHALQELALTKGRPFFGICVGMQLLFDRGLEHGDHPGLGWLAGEVRRLEPREASVKVPHMGWNCLNLTGGGLGHPLLGGWQRDDYVYFVHSYAAVPRDPGTLLATADHGGEFAAAVGRDNLFATQFHPEKSQRVGLRLFGRFLAWRP